MSKITVINDNPRYMIELNKEEITVLANILGHIGGTSKERDISNELL